jgi:NAD(P)-dependent dehydrogenase (short-subunit alcohol dehydrogenase family)
VAEMRVMFPDADIGGVAADTSTARGAASLIAAAEDADILVNNVGTARPKPFGEITDDDWLYLFQFNVMSGVRTRHHLPRMVERGWGRVVFISSESAVNIPKEMIDYGMTKTAQLAISRGLAESVAGSGVTVNAVLTRADALGIADWLDDGYCRSARHHVGRS